MSKNKNLHAAKRAKKDEFYTQYRDIETEISAYLDFDPDTFRDKIVLCPCDDPEKSNFTKFFALWFETLGLKKLICTSYGGYDLKPGKVFTLEEDINRNGKIDIDDITWEYLEEDGDFRSDEVIKLRDEADIIVTNPPFSLFREFIAWIVDADKKFIIIGNMNAITYKEVFPLIKNNKVWIGATNFNKGMYFLVNDNFKYASTYKFDKIRNGKKVNRVPSVCWFTNLEHGRRHEELQLLTKSDNLRYNKRIIKSTTAYKKYDNYDAIEVPFTNGIPSDYSGVMGVPISFLDKYCPDQFEIIGCMVSTTVDQYNKGYPYVNGKKIYARILIKHKTT